MDTSFYTHVYCTKCKWFKIDDDNIPFCCFSDECDLWDCEDSKPFIFRPKYINAEDKICE